MLHTLLRWFYCLPIPQALILLLFFSFLFLFLRQKQGKKRFWRLGIFAFALIWLLFIAAVTLMSRSLSESPMAPVLIPFHSYFLAFTGGNRELLRSNFMNVALFFPAGLVICELLPKGWRCRKKLFFIGVLSLFLSAGIEFCQFCFALGQAETDDVIHNVLGAVTGALVCAIDFKTESTTSAEDDLN